MKNIMKNKFVHLHVHTEYSLLDGLSKIKNLINHVKINKMDSVAITDHGAMYGVIEFYKKARKEGVKPLIGMEAYTTNIELGKKTERSKVKNFHQVLIAKNREGYKNLMKLTSIAHLEGYYYRPRVDKNILKKYSDGLICTSSCPQGELPQAIIENDNSRITKLINFYLEVFGEDYYLELQRHKYDESVKAVNNVQLAQELNKLNDNEILLNNELVKISRQYGIPIIATNDAHYIGKEDATAQDSLVCIATGKNVSDIKRLRFIDSPTFYVKSPEEMSGLFSDLPEALENTYKLSEKCSVEIELNKWFFPNFELQKGLTAEEELRKRVMEGLKDRLGDIKTPVRKRAEYELDIINKKGYATYFLIVADMARWAEDHAIITNTRGSTAGSLVAYALKIVSINPLDYDLPFERFLTPWRPSPPDIDFDIADDRREEIIKYLTQKYGKDKVAQICTFGRMMAKGSVRDIARVLGYPYAMGDRISKAIPFGSQGFPMSIKKALKISDDLKKLYEDDKDAKKIIDLAQQVEGNARHISVHAAGLVIAPEEITNFTPIQLDPEGKKIITQYDMEALDPNVSPNEAVGLLKFDLLGLRNLSILGSAIKIIEKQRGEDIDFHEVPLNDVKTYAMLSRGDTMGVFQLSGSGMTRYLKELKPERIEDLMAMVALYRPGPMAQIPSYIERKNNPEKVEFFDERMKEYLNKSYGLIVYQDDVFTTAIKIAGYTWEEADKFRKAVGKKIPQEMEKQKLKFIKGAIRNGLNKKKAEELCRLIEPFSGYGFNKAHAASYGMVAYWTAYLKANYPVEFMCALLTSESSDNDKVSAAVNECRRIGINVLPPDINQSETGFKIVDDKNSLEGKAIRFGLNAIKNVGKAAIEAILSERKKEKFLNIVDFASRVDSRKVNKKVFESLIKVGALSSFGKRLDMLKELDDIRQKVAKSPQNKNQQGLFSLVEVKKSFDMQEKNDTDIPNEEEFQSEIQNFERQLLGFSLSSRPLSEILQPFAISATHKIFEISAKENLDENVKVAVVIADLRIVVTRKTAQEMAFIRAEDETGSIELVVFPRIFERKRQILKENKPILATGKIDSREETPSIIIDNIEDAESLAQNKDRLFIKIPQTATAENLSNLKKLLQSNEGKSMVTLIFENGKNIDLNLGIEWNEDLAIAISEILNELPS